MDTYPRGVPGGAAFMALRAICTLVTLSAPLTSLAAERAVLCEEFTNEW